MSIITEAYEELSPLGLPTTGHPADLMDDFQGYDFSQLATGEVGPDVRLTNGGAVHPLGEYEIQPFVVISGPVVMGKNVRIGPWTFLRGPLFLGDNVQIGPWCEVVRSVILSGTRVCHVDYIADSVIGRNCWIAGHVGTANLKINNKPAKVRYNGEMRIREKFGTVVDSNTIIPSLNVIMTGAYIPGDATITQPGLVFNNGRHQAF